MGGVKIRSFIDPYFMEKGMRYSTLFGAILLALSTSSMAADSLINTNAQYSEDTTITISSSSNEASNRFVGIESNSGEMTVEIINGATLSITNQDNQTLDRYYGAATAIGSALNIDGDVFFDFTADTEQIRVVRLNGGKMDFDGLVTINANSNSNVTIGVDVWEDGQAIFKNDSQITLESTSGNVTAIQSNGDLLNFQGNVIVNATTDTGIVEGVHAAYGSNTIFSGDITQITVQTDGGRVLGVQNWNSEGATINFTSDSTTITAINSEDATTYTQGLLSYQSTTNFSGNTTFIVKGGVQTTYGVDVQCDPGLPYDTIVNFSGPQTSFDVTGTGNVYAVRPSGATGYINFIGDYVSIKASSTDGEAAGIRAQYGATLRVDNPDALLEITSTAPEEAYGILNTTYGGTGTMQFGSVNINANAVIDVSSQGLAVGIANYVDEGVSVGVVEDTDGIVMSGSTHLTVTADGDSGQAIGVYASNAQNGSVKPEAITSINNLVATVEGKNGAQSYGIVAESQSNTFLSGTSFIEAIGDNSVGAVIDDSTLTATGSLEVYGTQAGIQMNDGAQLNVDTSSQIVTNLMQSTGTTNLADGSALLVSGSTDSESSLGHINATSATIGLGAGSYSISTLVGNDNVLLLNDLANTSQVSIAQKSGSLSIQASGQSNDQYVNAQEAAQQLVSIVTISEDQNADENRVYVAEGQVNNSLSATVNEDGTLSNVIVQKNTTLDALGSVAAISALTLRHELNSLSKRMGELRDAPEGVGAWARVYGSELEYGHQNLESTNVTLQVGSDVTLGEWKVGAAFNYTNGDTDYASGSAESDNYGIALYGTWFVPCGAYVDLIARYARLDNDFRLNTMSGSYDNNAYSLSAETGYHWEVANGFFIEPQIGLSYSRINGATFTAANGVRVNQDDYESFMARAGVRTGVDLPNDKGTVYVRFSGIYDFEGELEGSARLGNAYNTIYEDLGGKWFETGIGANFNWTKNTYSYVDFERTSGGEVKENYRWNVGIRHTF